MSNDIFSKNQLYFNDAIEDIVSHDFTNSPFIFANSREGIINCRYSTPEKTLFMHSNYNMNNEVQTFSRMIEMDNTPLLIVGFSLGYHLTSLLQESSREIFILEPNIELFSNVTRKVDISSFLRKENLFFLFPGFSQNISEVLQRKLRIIIHEPSMKIITNKSLKQTIENLYMQQLSFNRNKELMKENFLYNTSLNLDNLSSHCIQSDKIILVASGPTLDRRLELLKELSLSFPIFAAGSALRILLKNNIIPSLVFFSDPLEIVSKQIEGIETSNLTGVFLSTSSSKTLKMFKGKKLIAFQNGYPDAQELAKKHQKKIYNVGGSVVTLMTDYAISLEPKNILFAGFNFSLVDGELYTKSTKEDDIMMDSSADLRKIQDYFGREIFSPKNLAIYKEWIERRIAEEKEIDFQNLCPEGAYIRNTQLYK
ncbi:motility associated factor glycosyltransferase family protein [Paenisporosarcina cavernae]|uniref:DUF115 domain-containing protein n=1 Tax=Paenisporosarcina cavernae TaxID=2320858 RepID=A0A385YR37_9BACL|nr:6-hydroxymethylpterin diphosphokinase MptE-like protein [Paenisporosarcina cavernae]AYC28951.1 DUF115 domain-containing protein [Paenisporosarcina cavernae]